MIHSATVCVWITPVKLYETEHIADHFKGKQRGNITPKISSWRDIITDMRKRERQVQH